MSVLPAFNPTPKFNVTRASHMAFTVADLQKSLDFYTGVVGLVVSAQDDGIAYLRGLEEDSHHSLILRQSHDAPACEQVGFRVHSDADLDAAADFFAGLGLEPRWCEVAYQRRTMRVRSPQGLPLEFCASMPILPRLHSRVDLHKGGAALRFDHTQVAVANVQEACAFFASFGFMVSDYSVTPAGQMFSAFMRRKDNPHDIVLGSRPGPRLHHFAYVADMQNLMRAGDVARSLGMRQKIEFGPSRHGQDHACFVYMRDPDGHRVELLSHPIQITDLDSLPICRDASDREAFAPWGQGAPASYHNEASAFPGEPLSEPVAKRTW